MAAERWSEGRLAGHERYGLESIRHLMTNPNKANALVELRVP